MGYCLVAPVEGFAGISVSIYGAVEEVAIGDLSGVVCVIVEPVVIQHDKHLENLSLLKWQDFLNGGTCDASNCPAFVEVSTHIRLFTSENKLFDRVELPVNLSRRAFGCLLVILTCHNRHIDCVLPLHLHVLFLLRPSQL